jgi:DNA transposition AAA+ family ATPase
MIANIEHPTNAATEEITSALTVVNKNKIAGDVVNKATADLPDSQRAAIRRLHAYYFENDLGLDELADKLRLSPTTISLVFRGQYGAKLDGVVETITKFFELEDRRGASRKLAFITTAYSQKIFDVCDVAVEFQKMAFIFGDGQVGKSTALKEYQRTHNHGNTIYVEMPTGGALTNFLAKLAEKFRLSPHQRKADLRQRILKAFDDRMLLIVDETQRCTPEGNISSWAAQTIDFIKEIYNERGCGVVICATNVFREQMETGPMKKFFEQIQRRRVCSVQLSSTPTQQDLNTFAAAYGLPASAGAARDLERQFIKDDALGMWLTLLRMGAKISAAKKKKMEWAHVLDAYAGVKALETGI